MRVWSTLELGTEGAYVVVAPPKLFSYLIVLIWKLFYSGGKLGAVFLAPLGGQAAAKFPTIEKSHSRPTKRL